jgi:hypothetical protein
MEARNYMPDLGRWANMDELSEDFYEWSPYNFSFNDPINFSDPSGLAPEGSNHWASTFVNSDGRVIEHRNDGDNNVYLVDNDWEIGGSKNGLSILGKEKPGMNYVPGFNYQFNENGELDYMDPKNMPRATGAVNSIGGPFDLLGVWEMFWDSVFDASGASSNSNLALATMLVSKGKAKPKTVARILKSLPNQIHHFATNKNKKWTPLMEAIAKKYGLSLNGSWNKQSLPHLGRHPNEYHAFVYNMMRKASSEAGSNKDKFLQLFNKYVKQPVSNNPEMLRKSGW